MILASVPRWVIWCASGAFIAALPTIVWRTLLGFGFTLGTPADWRASQDIPGDGTWYVLGLSVIQLIAAASSFALVVDIRNLLPTAMRQRTPLFVTCAGLLGAVALVFVVTMSVLAWENVDPFADQEYNAWAWFSFGCYAVAALWPVLLAIASVGYYRSTRRFRNETDSNSNY